MKSTRSQPSASMTFEQAFERMEALVEKLESGDATLEESLEAYEEGMALAKLCAGRLQDAELRLQKLVKGEDGSPQLELIR
jgi:exodeoxyribonuclease VII small subunit